MERNLIVTGPPGCGKTTVLLELVKMLSSQGYSVGGVICPEIRKGRFRVGFEIADLLGRRGILAHVSLASTGAPVISRYGVNLKDLDEISREAFRRIPDVFVVDEIGPMELKSEVFRSEVGRILDLPVPVVAAVHYRTSAGFIGRLKNRSGTKIITITPHNRNDVPKILFGKVIQIIGRETFKGQCAGG